MYCICRNSDVMNHATTPRPGVRYEYVVPCTCRRDWLQQYFNAKKFVSFCIIKFIYFIFEQHSSVCHKPILYYG